MIDKLEVSASGEGVLVAAACLVMLIASARELVAKSAVDVQHGDWRVSDRSRLESARVRQEEKGAIGRAFIKSLLSYGSEIVRVTIRSKGEPLSLRRRPSPGLAGETVQCRLLDCAEDHPWRSTLVSSLLDCLHH